MLKLILKDSNGETVGTYIGLEQFSKLFNDPQIISCKDEAQLAICLLRKHFTAQIAGIEYRQLGLSMGIAKDTEFTYGQVE